MRVFPICVNLNIFNSVDIRYGTSSLACYVKLKIIVALPAAMFAEDYYISIISKTQFALRRASSILSTMYAWMLLCAVFFYSQICISHLLVGNMSGVMLSQLPTFIILPLISVNKKY